MELDGALAAQAYLESGAWGRHVDQVQRLSEWAQREAFLRTATFTPEQSSAVLPSRPQIASHLSPSVGLPNERTCLCSST